MQISLEDKYVLERGRINVSGIQTLVRVLLEQRRRDQRAGWNTAGFVSGYRGSPLGGLDTALWQAGKLLAAHHIHFEPGLNEEIAATAVAGSQQVGVISGARYDGVFGLWYAKNPGVDRAADALKHGNAAGTSPRGGVLAVSGDDPGAASSSLPNQCDQAYMAALIPVLCPATVGEILEYGLLGYALSRYCGLWIGLKLVADVVESSATISIDPEHPGVLLPQNFERPAAGLGIRWPETRWDQDARLLGQRLPAAKAFVRANRMDRVAFGSSRPRFGIVTSGKAYLDVRQALDDLGIDARAAEELGLAVYKVAITWPLEPQCMREFALGLEEVIVVEERRSFIEMQLKEQAFNWPAGERPRIVGKTDERLAPLLPEGGELSSSLVAAAIGARLMLRGAPAAIGARLVEIELRRRREHPARPEVERLPHFCAGCPHARSTRVPEGSLAMGGIGCHSLRLWMPDSATMFILQMGGEGSNWLGLAPFIDTKHVFQNLGDGTYAHSGSLGIRAAVAAKRNITFRILYNEATAMTGGQPVEGMLTVPQITRQLHAEGAARIVVVSDEPEKYPSDSGFAPGVTVHHRDELERMQRELREVPGVTAILYDQVCATEKRRRRKRGQIPRAPVRAFINERVCEGCGDCVEQSQCAAVLPVETEFGRKRRIDQSACNIDLSCVNGFCPSFVTLEGAERRRPERTVALEAGMEPPPAPLRRTLTAPCNILINGIGGTGVITVGAILGMAAHLEGRACSVLDNTGIARKGGAVSTHVRLAKSPEELYSPRIADGAASLVLACDMVASAASASLVKISPGQTRVVANGDAAPTLTQWLDPDSAGGAMDPRELRAAIEAVAGALCCEYVGATEIGEHLVGDAIYANMVMLGYAWQKGLVPLELSSIERAMELNGNEIESNRRAFVWGRRAAHDPAAVQMALVPYRAPAPETGLDALIASRTAFLRDYQDGDYARRYADLVERVRAAEARFDLGGKAERNGEDGERLSLAVTRGYFRLLAIKDEYEVARLYSDGVFKESIRREFGGELRVRFHLAPPLFARRDGSTGHLIKREYGPWMGTALALLSRMRRLRGTWLDPFGHTAERRTERRLIAEYERTLDELLAGVTAVNYELAVEIASLPEKIRGYGHIKEMNLAATKKREGELLAEFRGGRAAAP